MKIGDRKIELNGFLWDTENFSINSKVYFTKEETEKLFPFGKKRLPTISELNDLFYLHHKWDENLKGVWFAKKAIELGTSESLFIPAMGSSSLLASYEIFDIGFKGRYWSSSATTIDTPYYLWFRDKNHDLEYGNFSQMLSIRLVQDI